MLFRSFMIVHMAGKTVAWDFREIAPAAATKDMFVADGKVGKGASTRSALAAAIPGQVRGLVAVHRAPGRERKSGAEGKSGDRVGRR